MGVTLCENAHLFESAHSGSSVKSVRPQHSFAVSEGLCRAVCWHSAVARCGQGALVGRMRKPAQHCHQWGHCMSTVTSPAADHLAGSLALCASSGSLLQARKSCLGRWVWAPLLQEEHSQSNSHQHVQCWLQSEKSLPRGWVLLDVGIAVTVQGEQLCTDVGAGCECAWALHGSCMGAAINTHTHYAGLTVTTRTTRA